VRIGVAEYAEFTVYTEQNSNPTDFLWTFYGSNGWAATASSSGITTFLENGAYKNHMLKATLGETAGEKVASCRILDEMTGVSATVTIPVTLVDNEAPAILSTTVLPVSPSAGSVLSFSASGTDAEGDLLTYQWYFPGFPMTLYGRTVYVDTTGMTPSMTVAATVTVIDRLGKSVSQSIVSPPLV
jgi:hypothetical protein